ncbi:MAG: DUF2752 domain-containing protein [Coprococcus sp.]
MGIPCFFYKITGYKCPGCGMTHALSEIWNGNFRSALGIQRIELYCFTDSMHIFTLPFSQRSYGER